jgi:hypothetical protein
LSINSKKKSSTDWQATVFYQDGERFARLYADPGKATGFADWQKKSPVVKMARVTEVN